MNDFLLSLLWFGAELSIICIVALAVAGYRLYVHKKEIHEAHLKYIDDLQKHLHSNTHHFAEVLDGTYSVEDAVEKAKKIVAESNKISEHVGQIFNSQDKNYLLKIPHLHADFIDKIFSTILSKEVAKPKSSLGGSELIEIEVDTTIEQNRQLKMEIELATDCLNKFVKDNASKFNFDVNKDEEYTLEQICGILSSQ